MYKKIKYWIFFSLLIFLLVGCEISSDSSQNQLITAEVVRVVDGDTIIVKMKPDVEERIRLLLVDTPESVQPNKPVQPFGLEASDYVKSLLDKGTEVKLELDVNERDQYGRMLAYVWIDEEMLNEMLLREGLARVAYVFEPNTKYADRFYEIEQEARINELGIWSINQYVLEKGFNEEISFQTTELSCSNPEIKGNHSSNGEWIYHMPGDQHYNQTNEEELFCTEKEALEAGYRKAIR